MKLLLSVSILLSTFSAHAYRVELATLEGLPNDDMLFISEILQSKVAIVPDHNLTDYTTATYYTAWRNGVQSAAAFQIFQDQGSATTQDVISGIDQASKVAAIVLAPVGPHTEELCSLMASHAKTVFLLPIASDAGYEDTRSVPSCFSHNILFIAGLNESLTDLASNQTQSSLIRVSAPYLNLAAPVAPNRSITLNSKSMSMGFIAGKMAELLRQWPQLSGAELVEAFIEQDTEYLPSLEGKVGNARSLVDVNY